MKYITIDGRDATRYIGGQRSEAGRSDLGLPGTVTRQYESGLSPDEMTWLLGRSPASKKESEDFDNA